MADTTDLDSGIVLLIDTPQLIVEYVVQTQLERPWVEQLVNAGRAMTHWQVARVVEVLQLDRMFEKGIGTFYIPDDNDEVTTGERHGVEFYRAAHISLHLEEMAGALSFLVPVSKPLHLVVGEYLGYPECCIQEFINTMHLYHAPEFDRGQSDRPLHGTGYCPCTDCSEKSDKELLAAIDARRDPTAHPFDEMGTTSAWIAAILNYAQKSNPVNPH